MEVQPKDLKAKNTHTHTLWQGGDTVVVNVHTHTNSVEQHRPRPHIFSPCWWWSYRVLQVELILSFAAFLDTTQDPFWKHTPKQPFNWWFRLLWLECKLRANTHHREHLLSHTASFFFFFLPYKRIKHHQIPTAGGGQSKGTKMKRPTSKLCHGRTKGEFRPNVKLILGAVHDYRRIKMERSFDVSLTCFGEKFEGGKTGEQK